MPRDPSLSERPAEPRLRERQPELRTCLDAIRAAEDGAGSVVVVRGPAGAGKTRLLAAAAAVARSSGLHAVHGTGAELEQALPFGLALDLLGASSADVAGADQLVVVRRLYERLVANGPVAVFVDDLHWVDEPSLRLLAYLARRIGDLPIVLVVATRPPAPTRAPGPADELIQTPGAIVLEPAPLSRTAIADVLGEHLPEEPAADLVEACAEATGGNPLLVLELARAIGAEGVADAAAVRAIGPQTVAWSTRLTLRGMGDEALGLAQALAVLEATDDLDVLLALAGVPAEAGTRLLGELEHAEIIRPAGVLDPSAGDGRGGLRLAHPLVRRALIEDLPDTTLGLMRRSAARLLHDRGQIGAAASQLLSALSGSAAWAVDTLVVAAEQASERAAPAEAARLLTRAVDEHGPSPLPRRADLLARLAHARAAASDPTAPEAFEAAVAAAGTADERAALFLALAWSHQGHGRFAEAVDASRRGLAEHPTDERTATGLAAMHDAAVHWSPTDDPSTAHLLPARVAASPGDAQAARVAFADEARRRVFAGDEPFGPVADLGLRAWDGGALLDASSADDPALVRVLRALHAADRLDDAIVVIEACRERAQQRGLAFAEVSWIHHRGHVRFDQGRVDEALVDLEHAVAAAGDGWGTWLPVAAGVLVHVHLERGDPDAAEAVLAGAEAAGTHPPESPMWTIAQAARGRLALARGETSVAVRHLLEAGRRSGAEMGTVNPSLGAWRSDAVVGLRRMRRHGEARALADDQLARARRWGSPRALASSLRASASVTDDIAVRRALLEEAVAVAAPSEARLEHAYAVFALGAELRRLGDTGSRARLQEAIELAEQCGAPALAQSAERQLVAAGGRVRRRPRAGREALTAGERRVARLAASGLSNRDIADELVVTPKAVAFHLGNAYRKLGVSGRRDLPADL